jgi:phosphoserine phosphatase RsbU/P
MPASVIQLFDRENDYSIEQQLALLAEITQSFASSLNVDEALNTALQQFLDYLNAEGAAIFLLENGGRELVCQACVGPVDVTGLRLPINQGIVGRAVSSMSCQMIRDASKDPDFYQKVDEDHGFVTRSILCAPLIVRGECLGALELLNKMSGDGLFDDHDKHLTQALASSAALAIHNARMADNLVEQERLRKELELAREIQVGLLPHAASEQFPVQAVNLSAQAVSGDFYDYLELADGRIYFNLADVSGKGMNAALMMAKASSLLRHLARTETDPGRLLTIINDAICESSSHGMFITIVSGFLEPVTGTVRFANAGHLPPMYQDAAGAFHDYPAAVPPLGVVPGCEYPVQTLSLAGGCLYLYTDGITEAENTFRQPLELAGFQALASEHIRMPLAQRLQAIIEDITRDHTQRDDMTLMLIGGRPA